MMWPPADINAVPTAREVIDAKLAVKAVKAQLENALVAPARAQPRVDELNQELIERQAWIAPVRILSFDVLSLIFEFCGEDDWRTPLLISEVSRHWREVVLATPRAWAFLHLVYVSRGHRMINRYFSLSRNCPLHIYLPMVTENPVRILSGLEKRLKCLSLYNINGYVAGRVFPILDRLTLDAGPHARIEISHLNDIQFPSLRHLICENSLIDSISGSSGVTSWEFPPLQSLSLQLIPDLTWLSLLTAVKSTLISLTLHPSEYCTVQQPQITLPALKCLNITFLYPAPSFWPLNLKTPVLETYVEITRRSLHKSLYHQDIQNVRAMRSDYPPTLSSLPLLEILRLQDASHVSAVFADLTSNESLCPNLQEVGLSTYSTRLSEEYCEFLSTKLPDVNRYRRVPMKLVVSNFSERKYLFIRKFGRELPYAIGDRPCGDTMPCNED